MIDELRCFAYVLNCVLAKFDRSNVLKCSVELLIELAAVGEHLLAKELGHACIKHRVEGLIKKCCRFCLSLFLKVGC